MSVLGSMTSVVTGTPTEAIMVMVWLAQDGMETHNLGFPA